MLQFYERNLNKCLLDSNQSIGVEKRKTVFAFLLKKKKKKRSSNKNVNICGFMVNDLSQSKKGKKQNKLLVDLIIKSKQLF